jgi:hypothetical protein
MPKQPKEKSAHLQELEAVFDRHTRRFSPFDVLGLRSSEMESDASAHEKIEGVSLSTPLGVGGIHPQGVSTPLGVGGIHMGVGATHPRVVEVKKILTTTPKKWGVDATHRGVDATHPQDVSPDTPLFFTPTGVRIHDVLAATQVKAQLGKKARQVLGYLNSIRSLERPAYTMPAGYTQISAAADVHVHYLRRNVLPKLAMIGLIGIVHKSLQGTIYHLHYDAAFLGIIAGDEEEPLASISPLFLEAPVPTSQSHLCPTEPGAILPLWIDREHWGWLTLESIQQLIAKTGSEAQAQEKLDIILYNEAHGPAERRIRDRRAVLAHYLHTPHADIWPNDDGFETLALRRVRQERDQALQEKALAEEILYVRQKAAQARFLASLAETQLQWLKQEARQRVDAQPSARFLASRYPLYKTEEEQLIHEWMDRVDYGESVPHIMPERH